VRKLLFFNHLQTISHGGGNGLRPVSRLDAQPNISGKQLKSEAASSILGAGEALARGQVDGDADMMSRKTYFHQECPTCGRTLQVRVEYLGRQVACQHCGAQFEACDPDSALYPPSESGIALLRRAEELLDAAESGIFKIPSTGATR
jgi:hypothetical protein